MDSVSLSVEGKSLWVSPAALSSARIRPPSLTACLFSVQAFHHQGNTNLQFPYCLYLWLTSNITDERFAPLFIRIQL